MGEGVDENLAPAPGAAIVAPPEEDLAPAPGAAIIAPGAEDPELAFLKPGFKRQAPGPGPLPGSDATPDRIGQAQSDYQTNVAGLAQQKADFMAPPAAPHKSGTAEAIARGALQGATLGFADEIGAAAESIMGPRSYESYRDEIRGNNRQAKEDHPYAYGGGEIGGGIATAFVPGLNLAKGASIAKVAGQGALLGGAAAAGESEATDAKQLLKDTTEGATIGGVGGVVLHKAAGTAAKFLASKLPELADKQAAEALTRKVGKAGAPESLTRPVIQDPNLSAAINEPIQTGGKKAVTLAQIAGKPAAEARAVLKAGQEKIDQGLEGHFHTGDAASGGGGKLSDLVRHLDSEAAEHAKNPLGGENVKALEGARDKVLNAYGPSEQAIEQRQAELENARGKIYDTHDKKTGGVRLGDLVDHYDARIAEAKKIPGNEPVVAALEKARDSAVNAWGKKPVFNPEAIVEGGAFEGGKAGDAVAKLEKMAQQRPAMAADLNAEAQRIRDAATAEGIDRETRVPAREVRRYATHLQNEGATDVADPKIAARAKQLLGSTTKDFVNGAVEKGLGKADRKALESLNQRTADMINWQDVLAGKNKDAALRDRVLDEFDTRVPTAKLDELASGLEERGQHRIDRLNKNSPSANAKENLGAATRDFVNQHLAKTLSPEDLAEARRLTAHRGTFRNIDKVLEDRASREAQNKTGHAAATVRGVGHALAAPELVHAAVKGFTGDIPGALLDVGKAAAIAGLPHAITQAGAAKRALVRGAARATDYLANVVASAEGGNSWAKNQLAMLMKSSPAGAARVAAAIARHRGMGGGGTVEP